MLIRHLALQPLTDIFSDVGGGGTTDNTASRAGSGDIESGEASDSMVDAVEASSASEDDPDPDLTGDDGEDTEGDLDAGGDEDDLATSGATGSRTSTGEAPQNRITAAVRNARAEVEKSYAWAKGLSADEWQLTRDLVTSMYENPSGFTERLAAQLGMKLVPLNGAEERPATGAAAAATKAKEFQIPKGSLRAEDGTEAFSAPQVVEIVTQAVAQLRQEMMGHVSPLINQNKQAEMRSEVQQSVSTMMKDFRARPYFQVKDTKGATVDHPSIRKNLLKIPVAIRNKIGAESALSRAYNQYLAEEVFPHIGASAEGRVRSENARLARAGTGNADPASGAGRTRNVKLKDGDVSGLARHLERLAGSSRA